MTDFERAGEEALERAQALLAKAKSMDADFEGLDEPELPEELDETDDLEDDEERAAQHDERLRAKGQDDEEEDDEDEEEDEEEGAPRPVAKAVDALPLLAAIEERLRRVEALEKRLVEQERRLGLLVKGLEALTSGVKTLAKGYAVLAETPRKPKVHRVAVPTQVPRPSLSEVMAKAAGVVKDPYRMAILEHYANRGDLEGVLANLLPEERAKIVGGEA